MKDEMLDRILAGEEELIPSSGFAALVMDRIRDEAAVPRPIAFPWKRAVPGIALATGVLGWAAVEFVRYGVPAARGVEFVPPHISSALQSTAEGAMWVAIALGVSLVSWLLSRFMTGSSGVV